MNPILSHLGPLEIRYYGVLMMLAFLIGYFILKKIATEKGLSENLIDNYFIWLIPTMILGARLFEILFYEPQYYFANPIRMLYIWQGGIASHGAIFAAILTTYFFTKKYKIPFYKLADLVVIPCALGAAFVRIGNFINGEIVGTITNLPIGIKFPNYEGLRHPVQLYEAFTNTFLFFLLFNLRKKKLKEGMLFSLFILLYSIFRFFNEFLKDFPKYFYLGLGQWFSIILIILATIFLYKINKKIN